jgi:P-aminobenzoate N-oxygenase AurF
MRLLEPAQIKAQSDDPARCTRAVTVGPIDWSRPFIHEAHTQLYYTPSYGALSAAQRLRYNQLFGVRVNEQFMTLERDLTNRVLVRVLRHPGVAADPVLGECLTRMVSEEERHYAMFRDLNLRCLPDVYAKTDRYFLRFGRLDRALFAAATGLARRLPWLLWLVIAMEEYSIALSRSFIRRRETESLGPLEENFVRIHAEHVKDETRHVQLDVHVIEACHARSSRVGRALDAALLKTFLRDILVPKRSGLAVVRRWVAQDPALRDREHEFVAAVRGLAHDDAYQRSLFSREIMPRTFALFDTRPELADLGRVLRGYSPRA